MGTGEFEDKSKMTKADMWFSRDEVAKEIRNISKRIIDSYEQLDGAGDESVGLVDNSKIKKVRSDLQQAFHDLEEFDVTPRIHVGKDPEFFYDNPRATAEFGGGQLLILRNIPLTTDMERNRAITGIGLENIIDRNQQWPLEVKNMTRQEGIIEGVREALRLK